MDPTAIQAGSPPGAHRPNVALSADPPPAPRPQRAPKGVLLRALEAVADLRITVVLFVLSLFLVFFGTLAQQDRGTWTAVSEYFRSFGVLIPMNVVCIRPIIRYDFDIRGAIPYPGGFTLGTLLLVNLLAAHIVSFKLTWKRTGILLIHAGIVVMMLSELTTYLFAAEGQMLITEGDSSNYLVHVDQPELAVVDASDLKQDRVTVVPKALLRRGGLIQDASLPFDVVVDEYMVNSELPNEAPGPNNPATKGIGLHVFARPRPESAGVDVDQHADQASIYATLKRKGTGESLGTYLFSVALGQPDRVEVDGKVYEVSLRLKRSYKSYTFRLDKLNVEYYKRTTKPKDFSSFIHLTDPENNENRDLRIYMNHPLHYAGETFYQSRVDTIRGKPATILQVVRNPGWLLPYVSCFMVAFGMLIHFGMHLYRFVGRAA